MVLGGLKGVPLCGRGSLKGVPLCGRGSLKGVPLCGRGGLKEALYRNIDCELFKVVDTCHAAQWTVSHTSEDAAGNSHVASHTHYCPAPIMHHTPNQPTWDC